MLIIALSLDRGGIDEKMTPWEEPLHVLKDFPPVPTKAWEAAIHVDLKGQGKSVFTQCQTGSGVAILALGEMPEVSPIRHVQRASYLDSAKEGYSQESLTTPIAMNASSSRDMRRTK